MKLHLFNPGYESGVLSGSIYYTSPKNVQQMRRELSTLPVWYGEPGDYVWIEDHLPDQSLPELPDLFPELPTLISHREWDTDSFRIPPLEAAPWGISIQSIAFFERLKIQEGRDLYIPPWKESYKTLMGRQTAAVCLDRLRQLTTMQLPATPHFCKNIEELESYIHENIPPFVLKMPYSSSGRGLLRIDGDYIPEKEREWISGALKKQQFISIEPRLQKEIDFALEFYLHRKGKALYKGISVFETDGWKTYSGNRIASQSKLENIIIAYIGKNSFEEIKEQVAQVIEEIFGKEYSGYIGVDMMLYTTPDGIYHIHPCVEINMRYTMGMAAIRIFERFIDHGSEGFFRVVYDPEAYLHHCDMQQKYPPVWSSGRLEEGYFSLCPVVENSRYRAYVHIL